MDSDSWTGRISSGPRRYHSRSDLYYGGGDEVDGEDDLRPEFLCPFCAEEFDVVGLCCHIDEEHAVEAKNGVCPICAKRVGMDLVGHITMQHGSLLKVQRKRRLRKGGSNLTFALLRKELRDGNLNSFLGGSQSFGSSSAEPDPLLSSFMSNLSVIDEPVEEKAPLFIEASLEKELEVDKPLERNVQQPLLSDKDQEEKARKSEFVRGLLLSTFMDEDDL